MRYRGGGAMLETRENDKSKTRISSSRSPDNILGFKSKFA